MPSAWRNRSWIAISPGTTSTVEGVGLAEISEETSRRHRIAFGNAPLYRDALDIGGEYAYRLRGEAHTWTPATISTLQHATRSNSYEKYAEFCRLIDEQNEALLTLRGLMSFKEDATPVPLDEVESAADIVSVLQRERCRRSIPTKPIPIWLLR